LIRISEIDVLGRREVQTNEEYARKKIITSSWLYIIKLLLK